MNSMAHELNVRDIPLKKELNPEERRLALAKAQEITKTASSITDFTKLAEFEASDGKTIWLSKGHAGYHGAMLVVDVFDGDPRKSYAERPASYGIYEDKVICVEDYFTKPIEEMPAHEAGVEELIPLLIQLQIIAGANNL